MRLLPEGPEPAAADLRSVPWVEFRVSDTGPGVAPEDQERIFAPFEQIGDPARSESMVRGSGLGLTVARQLSRLLRGSLVLDRTSVAGSSFCVRLPVRIPSRHG